MEAEDGVQVMRHPSSTPRQGWSEASKALARSGEDGLVMGEFSNTDEIEIEW
jgi:antitoxin MazE